MVTRSRLSNNRAALMAIFDARATTSSRFKKRTEFKARERNGVLGAAGGRSASETVEERGTTSLPRVS